MIAPELSVSRPPREAGFPVLTASLTPPHLGLCHGVGGAWQWMGVGGPEREWGMLEKHRPPRAGLAELLWPGRPLCTARWSFLQSHPCLGKRAASVSSRGSSYVIGQEACAGTWGREGTRVYLRTSARVSCRVCRHRPSGAEAAGPTLSLCRCVLLGSHVQSHFVSKPVRCLPGK